MPWFIIFIIFLHYSVPQMCTVDWSAAQGKTCVLRNKGKKFDIQQGEVTGVKKDKVKVCDNGKLVEKEKSEVPTPYKIGCNGGLDKLN